MQVVGGAAHDFPGRHPSKERGAELLELANREEVLVGLRGAGRSYGDAAMTGGGIVAMRLASSSLLR